MEQNHQTNKDLSVQNGTWGLSLAIKVEWKSKAWVINVPMLLYSLQKLKKAGASVVKTSGNQLDSTTQFVKALANERGNIAAV